MYHFVGSFFCISVYHNRGVLADGGGNEEMLEWSHENEKKESKPSKREFSHRSAPSSSSIITKRSLKNVFQQSKTKRKTFPQNFHLSPPLSFASLATDSACKPAAFAANTINRISRNRVTTYTRKQNCCLLL